MPLINKLKFYLSIMNIQTQTIEQKAINTVRIFAVDAVQKWFCGVEGNAGGKIGIDKNKKLCWINKNSKRKNIE